MSEALLHWYRGHARALPWRALPGSPAPPPYHVWLSEIMLQQTTVAAVIPYFAKFVARWPTVQALAGATDEEVMRAWAGLGYYARARNLLACARRVADTGFPATEAGLRALPGIGRYTAAAITAIAFGQRAVVVDGNIERVVARLFAVATPLPAATGTIYAHMDEITPEAHAGDLAQGMMDLGRTICTPRNPHCLACPLQARCQAFAEGNPAAYPIKPAKRARPERTATALWHERDGQVALVRHPPRGLLGGMLGLPLGEDDGPSLGRVVHVFTHFRLTLDVRRADRGCIPPADAEWWPREGLEEAGLPTVFKKAVRLGLGNDDARPAA